MALKLDNNLLVEIGLGALPQEEKSKMLAHIYETLEMRVGVRLAEQMTDQQLDEFESFINAQDEAGALRWLETTFPSYKQVVADEFEKLKNEIRQVAPQIVAEAQQAAANPQSQQQMPPQQPQYPPQQQYPGQQPMSGQADPYSGQYPPQQPPAAPPQQ
jgi:hypothetical protein